jgi:geranylgeranylglycerol-phosphate geranylgeranyltransferase
VQPIINTLKLIRVVNCLLAAFGVIVGARMAWTFPVYYGPALTAMAAFLVCAAGNSLNDLSDIEIDRVSHPERVLVRGELTTQYALILSLVLNALAIVLALAVNLEVTAIIVVAIALLVLYNRWLKRWLLVGNLAVALLAALTFMAGGFAVDSVLALTLPGPLIPAVFALLFHLVREIVKDVQDMEGDQRAGYRSLPLVIGSSKSLIIALILFVILLVCILAPIWMGWFGRAYEVISVYIVGLPLLGLLVFLWGNPNPRMLRIASTGLKVGMVLGLAALVTTVL